ncbi:MAG TPA: RIP metalloprotease RseP, partial [Bacillota bacterium]|nr:RIP metalloprotease RseP [Bacillota bacterium]
PVSLATVKCPSSWMSISSPTTQISEVIKDAPAAAAGIKPGDTIMAINGSPINRWEDLVSQIQPKAGETVRVTVKRSGQELTFNVKVKAAEQGKGLIGIKPGETVVRQTLVSSLVLGVKSCINATTMIADYLGKMVSNQVPADSLGGPVRITVEIGKAAKTGLLNLANLTAVLSINLGLFNLFPIPALDGSRILFLLIEALRGKPVNPARENMVHLIGLGLLMLLMVFVTVNDVSQLVKW